MLVATDRAVYAITDDGMRELVELAGDESITGTVAGTPPAVFVQSPRGARVIVGRRDATITLSSAGREPLRHDRAPF